MRRAILIGCLAINVVFNLSAGPCLQQIARAEAAAPAKVRSFIFHYRFQVTGLKATGDSNEDSVRVWLPCPASSACQQITRLPAVAPGEISEYEEPRFNNRILFLQTPIPASGTFTVDVPYDVTRREVLRETTHPINVAANRLDAAARDRYLRADKLVPTSGKPLELLEHVTLRDDQLDRARQLYDLVDEHVAYKKDGVGWGRGDSNWVCDSRYGNCTDFHSLFMSLARSQGLPTRFEIGFSIPADAARGPITGYHCWAWFHADGRGWIPVDISEADKHPEMKDYYFGNLTADRVMFSAGRDIELVPQANHPPLNYFIYPHIEVGGNSLADDKIELQFSFQDKQ